MPYRELRVLIVRIHSTNKHCVWTNCRALRVKNGSSYNNHEALKNSGPVSRKIWYHVLNSLFSNWPRPYQSAQFVICRNDHTAPRDVTYAFETASLNQSARKKESRRLVLTSFGRYQVSVSFQIFDNRSYVGFLSISTKMIEQ